MLYCIMCIIHGVVWRKDPGIGATLLSAISRTMLHARLRQEWVKSGLSGFSRGRLVRWSTQACGPYVALWRFLGVTKKSIDRSDEGLGSHEESIAASRGPSRSKQGPKKVDLGKRGKR